MQARSLALSFVAAAALTACQATETAEQTHARMQMESDSVQVVLQARATAFTDAYNAGNADAAAAFYAEDAVLMPPGMPAVTGRDAIRDWMARSGSEMPPGAAFSLRVVDVVANGPLAVDRGEWTMTIPNADGAAMEFHGKYLVAWQRIDGDWLMVSDIWNGDAPEPPMEAPGN